MLRLEWKNNFDKKAWINKTCAFYESLQKKAKLAEDDLQTFREMAKRLRNSSTDLIIIEME